MKFVLSVHLHGVWHARPVAESAGIGTLGCWMAFAMFDPGRWLYSATWRTAVVHLAEALISSCLQRRELRLVH